MTTRIDLNADLGEGGPSDRELMTVVTSCNIACGGHAGDATSMQLAVTMARDHGVSAGAHPSFPDRENFGRTEMSLRGEALEAELSAQVKALCQIAEAEDVVLSHLKPHGALYNMAAKDRELADSIVHVLQTTMPNAYLVGPPRSELEAAAAAVGVAFVAEGFADRAYEADASLRSRSKDGAVFHETTQQLEQALGIALHQRVRTHDGEQLHLPVQTLCVHGDTPGAFEAAKAIREGLEASGVTLGAPR